MNSFAPDPSYRTLLKVLVGSRAHGLHNEDSDYDYRGVFLVPTAKLLSLYPDTKNVQWIEGDIDNTSWELGHFLHMATKCNPTILECFAAPVHEATKEGMALRDLFPHVWNSTGVMNAFIGYGLNQRKKFLDSKDGRPAKFAVAYARSLYMAEQLLLTGELIIDMTSTKLFSTLVRWKGGVYTMGEVIDVCADLEAKVKLAHSQNPDKQTNLEAVNDYLYRVRKFNLK